MAIDLKNPFSFSPLSKQEHHKASEAEKTLHDIETASEDALKTAQDCLSSDLFAKYRSTYVQAQKDLIEMGIRLDFADPIQYAVAAHAIFDRLNILRMLLEDVTEDAGRKPK